MAIKKTRGAPKRCDPLSYEAIADAYRQELRALPGGGPFSDYALVRLRRIFGGRRLAAITDEAVRDYALRREEQDGAAPAIINVELDTLWKIQLFAVKHGLITNERCCRIERLPVAAPPVASSDSRPRPAGEGLGLRRSRWFKPAAPVDGARPAAAAPPKPPRRKVEPEDIADIREKNKNADKQSRNWWVDRLTKAPYCVTYHPKSVAAQLKALGIPPTLTQ